jgi:cytochrome c biogenesis protein CcmG, thiol:disulfide interchange protein DsbE
MKARFLVPAAMFALLVVLLAVGIKHSPDKGNIPSPLIGKPAPEFSLPLLTDSRNVLHSSDLKGHWYVFNVWGTWCGGCREEHTTLLQIKKTALVPLIGLDWRDTDAEALQWLSELGNPYESVAVDREGRTAIDYGVYGAPETFLINPEGVVVYKYIGPLTQAAWEREFVPRLPPHRDASL